MFLTARDNRREIFLTVGDAISSFLEKPDMTTEGRCLSSKFSITKSSQKWSKSLDNNDFSPKKSIALLPDEKRWAKSVSILFWVMTITLYVHLGLLDLSISLLLISPVACSFSLSGFLLSLSTRNLTRNSKKATISALWNLGFGTTSPSATVHLCRDPQRCAKVIPMILLANSPQVPVSIAYFLYNNVLTIMLLAAEYNDYARQRKPLRVSWPRGLQRSTYYLSLPYRYSIPLLVSHMVLHWLVSQSLFYVEVLPYDFYGKPKPSRRLVTCGFSPIAIIFGIGLGSSMVFAILGLGLRRFQTNIPLAVSCSAAISAACHPPPGDGHALKPVMWGEIPKEQITHATTCSEADDEETTLHSESSLDIVDRESNEDDSNSDTNQRQGDGSQAQLLTEENDSGEEDCAENGHCSFSSRRVITPSPLRRYA